MKMALLKVLSSGYLLFGLSAISSPQAQADIHQGAQTLSYCVPVSIIDLNPFREIKDGKDLAYLLLMRSYISTDPAEPGLLESYEFSPDGTLFSGKLAANLRWNDGSPVTPFEAAMGIAKTLQYRALGERVQVLGTDEINSLGWEKRSYSGIEILNERTFRLTFKSKIANLTGVVREALSTNSRHNRFWPTKLYSASRTSYPQVLMKYPVVAVDSKLALIVGNQTVIVANSAECDKADFTIFPEQKRPQDQYTMRKSPSPSAAIIQTNTNRLNLKERVAVIEWIRSAFASLPAEAGIEVVDSFFSIGEPGYTPAHKWGILPKLAHLKHRKLKIAYEIPQFRSIVEASSKKAEVDTEFVQLPSSRTDIDIQLLASGIQDGRYLILQDALRWPHVEEFMKLAPRTKRSLLAIASKSASTLPPDNETLKIFEANALEEASIAPISRRYPVAFSRAQLAICLAWTQRGELTFVPKEHCSSGL